MKRLIKGLRLRLPGISHRHRNIVKCIIKVVVASQVRLRLSCMMLARGEFLSLP